MFRSRLRQAIYVADSITTSSTILNQTRLSRLQGGFALDGLVAATLDSSLIEIKTRELVSDPIEQGYNLVVGVPSVEDYCRLRVSAGLSPKSPEAAAAGLPNTLFGVLVLKEDKVIGMGRVVGDDGLFYQVVDIAVEPEHQRRGLGKAIMGKIVDHLKRSAPSGAHVSLIGSPLRPILFDTVFGVERRARYLNQERRGRVPGIRSAVSSSYSSSSSFSRRAVGVTSHLNRPVFADMLMTKIVAYREYHPHPSKDEDDYETSSTIPSP